jgi:hypothetical protein
MERGEKFDAHDAVEGVVGGEEESATFAGSDVEEGEAGEVDGELAEHVAEEIGVGGLIPAASSGAGQAGPCGEIGGRGVYSLLEVVVKVTEAGAAALGSGIAEEIPEVGEESAERARAEDGE